MKFSFTGLIPLFVLLFTSLQLTAQDVSALIKEGNRLENMPDEKAAFTKFREVLKFQPVNQYALNKCSELCSRIGKRQTNPQFTLDYYAAAKTYATMALKVNPSNSESNCVMAMALGRSSLNKSGKEKITNAKEVKKYVDASIKYDPRNFKAWHILGRWNYEVSTLNGFERVAVKILYGGLPAASLRESIIAFETCQAITDGFILNYFEMAKAYKMNDQPAKAIATLTRMLNVPNQTEDDPGIKEQGRKLLKEWN